jgi:hypothetical protein
MYGLIFTMSLPLPFMLLFGGLFILNFILDKLLLKISFILLNLALIVVCAYSNHGIFDLAILALTFFLMLYKMYGDKYA